MRPVESAYQVYGTYCYHSKVCYPSKITYLRHYVTANNILFLALISILGIHPNNTIRLYLDGIFVAEAADSLTILRKDRHKLQAVQVEDGSAEDVLFLASSSNGINSDEHWRCTNAFDEGWFLPNYTDISWPKVFVLANNTGSYFIAPDAKWIGYEFVSNRIYCRRNLATGKKIFFSISQLPKVLVHGWLSRSV